jgi:hypothetical protein
MKEKMKNLEDLGKNTKAELIEYQKLCKNKLLEAIQKLGFTLNSEKASEISNLIVQTMNGRWRYFHDCEHIFTVAGNDHPLEIIAGLFHDLVYVQVDDGINSNLAGYLTPYIEDLDNKHNLAIKNTNNLVAIDSTFEMVLSVFGFAPGQTLSPLAGQNEFLSALITAKILESFLSLSLITQIVTIIEATIPFRPRSREGFTVIEQLKQRLEITNSKFALGLTAVEIETTLQQAVRVSNRDVSSFAYAEAADFLDKTWSLLPETNHALVQTPNYTIRQYRLALQKMDAFFNFLQPEMIFIRCHSEPSAENYQKFIDRATHNLQIGKLYLASKLIAIGLLEALSLKFNSNISFPVIIDNFRNQNNDFARVVNFLPREKFSSCKPENIVELEVLHLLQHGRHQSLDYDLKESPLASFLIKYITFAQVTYYRKNCYAFFDGELSTEEFLASFPTDLVEIISGLYQVNIEQVD